MSLEPVPDNQISAIRNAHPNLPTDYLDFLSSHGWGELASGVQLYSGPIAPEDVYGPRASKLPIDTILIADDFAGTCFAFVPSRDWSIVSIESIHMELYSEAKTFTEFLGEYHQQDVDEAI